jgi:uncharacterized protein YidB (DUF937 family)
MDMGLLDSVIGAVAGNVLGGGSAAGSQAGGLGGMLGSLLGGGAAAGGGGQSALLNIVLGMVANQAGGNHGAGGGLGDLIGKFQQGGLGDVAASWVGSGQNMPVSADQLSNVLGSDMLSQIASQLGVSHGDAAGQLSQMLPEVINHLTPNGQAPSGGLGDIGSILAQFGQK